ncbi:Ldh family oxidoreductase [Corynebacterium liangguodongii]|uniref:Malate dehydrogenase n=1 Tax=Corynebacterium liangguodongii TaxID=2079535 RepID=A0A2S0WGR4_9CORY|nr:Ldh family oxidoreductase [Corynebacterium liangguodongii]AWB84914.1 malate dehydrogenase [Corynebacterium liangguodongii]PWB99378.1 malate dehydrogenase [Corynebacterium liangguodongii]
MKLDIDTVRTTFRDAFLAHGMSRAQAESPAGVFLDAELAGKPSHGAYHLLGYLDALDEGRINGDADPKAKVRGAVLSIDADEGLAQYALEHHLDALVDLAHAQGVAVAAVGNTYTTGELGWYPRLFSRHGLVSLTATNSPALVALSATGERVVGTNPMAFGVPGAMVIDQAVTPEAFLKVRQRAERGEAIPEGWAVDGEGRPTTDAAVAVEEGAMLPNGGRRGGNLALILETLAMLAGGESSLAAAGKGKASPSVGLFCLVMDPSFFGEGSLERLVGHLELLRERYEVYIPGRGHVEPGELDIDDGTWSEVLAAL